MLCCLFIWRQFVPSECCREEMRDLLELQNEFSLLSHYILSVVRVVRSVIRAEKELLQLLDREKNAWHRVIHSLPSGLDS